MVSDGDHLRTVLFHVLEQIDEDHFDVSRCGIYN